MGRYFVLLLLGLSILFITCSVGCIDLLVPQEVTVGELLKNYDNYTGKTVSVSGDPIEFLDDGYVISDSTGDIQIITDKKPQYRESVKVTGVVEVKKIARMITGTNSIGQPESHLGGIEKQVLITERSKTTIPLVVNTYCTNKIVAIPKNADIYVDGKFVGSGSTEVNVSHQIHEIQAKYKDMSSQGVPLYWNDCGYNTLVAVEPKNNPYFIYVNSATVSSPWTSYDGSSGKIIVTEGRSVGIHGFTNLPPSPSYDSLTMTITGPVTITTKVDHFEGQYTEKSGDLSVRGFVIGSGFENHPGTYFFTITEGGYQNVKTSGSFTIPTGQQEDIPINMDPSVFET